MFKNHASPFDFSQVFDEVLTTMPLIVFVIDAQGVFQFSKGQGLAKLGLKDNQVVGLHYRTLYQSEPAILGEVEAALAGQLTECRSVVGNQHYQVIYRILGSGNECHLLGIALDETSLVNVQALADQLSNQMLQAYEISQQGMWSWDVTNNQVEHNPAWRRIFGYTEGEDSSDLSHFIQRIHPDDLERVWADVEKAIQTGETFNHTYRILTPSGEGWVRDSGRVVQYSSQHEPIKMIGSLIDLTDQYYVQQKLSHLLHLDELTGLATRYAAKAFWDKASLDALDYAFVLFDVQGFKLINDVLGHEVGDRVLQKVANHLTASFPTHSHISRVHKDDYLIILPAPSAKYLKSLVKSALSSLTQIQISKDYPLKLSARAGVSFAPAHGLRFDELFHRAETALYKAKVEFFSACSCYQPEFASQSQQHLRLLSQIQQAMQNGEFYLVYQPQIDLSSGRCVGAEVLMRWQNKAGEMIPPVVFIPIAEQSRFILPMTYWLIERALAQLHQWRQSGLEDLYLAINIPASFLAEANVVEFLTAKLARFGLASCCLELEVTESELIQEGNQTTLQNISALAEAGFPIAVDDFGTGYSNLAQLRKLDVNKLKIDKSFVDELTNKEAEDMQSITKAILAMAQALKLRVVAEGVETNAQMEWLKRHGCEYVQGYYFAKPMSESDFHGFATQAK